MTNEELTRIYCEANGLRTNEFATITTERVFAAMRAAMEIEREACARLSDFSKYSSSLNLSTGILSCECANLIRGRGGNG